MASFTSKLKKKLNGLHLKVERVWKLKSQIENKKELTAEEKQKRKEALRQDQLKKFDEKSRELKNFLEHNKTSFEEIPETEPTTSKAVSRGQRHQGRARERLNGIDGLEELNEAVKSEFEDPAKPENYKRELWKIAKSKQENIGTEAGGYYEDVLNNLRRKHLMSDDQRGSLRKTEAIEDFEDQAGFAIDYLREELKETAFANLENLNSPGIPENQKEHVEKIDKIFNPIKSGIENTIKKHKP